MSSHEKYFLPKKGFKLFLKEDCDSEGENMIELPNMNNVKYIEITTGYEKRLLEIKNNKNISCKWTEKHRKILSKMLKIWKPQNDDLTKFLIPKNIVNLAEIYNYLVKLNYCHIFGIDNLEVEEDTLYIDIDAESG